MVGQAQASVLHASLASKQQRACAVYVANALSMCGGYAVLTLQRRRIAPAPQSLPLVPAPQSLPRVPAPQSLPRVPAPQSLPRVPAPQSLPLVPAPQSLLLVPAPQSLPLCSCTAIASTLFLHRNRFYLFLHRNRSHLFLHRNRFHLFLPFCRRCSASRVLFNQSQSITQFIMAHRRCANSQQVLEELIHHCVDDHNFKVVRQLKLLCEDQL
jgi:hypothetical protein